MKSMWALVWPTWPALVSLRQPGVLLLPPEDDASLSQGNLVYIRSKLSEQTLS